MELDRYIRCLVSLRDLDYETAMKIATSTFETRLVASRSGAGDDECWPWRNRRSGAHVCAAYPWFAKAAAHRVSWEVANGTEIPKGGHIMHICDNPPCVNPAHLRVGNNKDNIDDMVAKNRVSHGEAHYLAKLSPLKVRATRTLFASGQFTQKEIGDIFGVTRESIRQVLQGQTWTRVDHSERGISQ